MKGNIVIFGEGKTIKDLEYFCQGSGYRITHIRRPEGLKAAMAQEETVLLLYDFESKTMKETDSLALLAELREGCNKPIIALADKSKEMLRILALNAGADDVLDHTDSSMECLARIEAKLRCYRRLLQGGEPAKAIRMGDLEMDDRAKIVSVKGNPVDLTPTEYKILRLLIEKPGKVLSNKEIYESIWKMEPIGAENTIAVHIRHIREKIEENPQEPRHLQVVWGQGYKVS